MPDSYLHPLAPLSDERAQNFNLGVGNANTSELGSFIEGFRESAKDFTAIRTSQLKAQVDYDPDKLLADQVKRDLDNQVLEQSIKEAKIKNELSEKYGERELLSSIRYKDALSRSQEIGASLDEEFGFEKAQSEIERNRALTEEYRSQAEARRAERRQEKLDEWSGLPATMDKEDQIAKEKDPEIRSRLIKELEQSKKDFGITPEEPTYKSSGMLPPAPKRSSLSEEGKRQFNQQRTAFSAQNTYASAEDTDLESRLDAQNIQAGNQLNASQRQKAVVSQAQEYIDEVSLSAREGNITAAIPSLGKLSKAINETNDPETRSILSQTLLGLTEHTLGLDAIKKEIDSQTDPVVKDGLQKIYYGIAATTGRMNLLSPIQQNVAGIFAGNENMTPVELGERISNPDEVQTNLLTLMQGNAANVEDNTLKTTQVGQYALEDHPYMSAALKASGMGRNGFKVYTETMEVSGSSSADIVSKNEGPQQVMVLDAGGGNIIKAPIMADPASRSLRGLITQIGSTLSTLNATDSFADQQLQQIEGRSSLTPSPRQAIQTQAPEPTATARTTTPSDVIADRRSLRKSTGLSSMTTSPRTAESMDSLLRVVQDGTYDKGFIFKSSDEKAFNSFVDNSIDDLWNGLPAEQKQVFEAGALKRNQTSAPTMSGVLGGPTVGTSKKMTGKDYFRSKIRPELDKNVKSDIDAIAKRISEQKKEQKVRRMGQANSLVDKLVIEEEG